MHIRHIFFMTTAAYMVSVKLRLYPKQKEPDQIMWSGGSEIF